jgi:allantoicase
VPEQAAEGQTPSGSQRAAADGEPIWRQVVPRTRVLPDTLHRFVLGDAGDASRVRLDVYPDGGLARLRIYGEFTPGGLGAIERRWRDTGPHAGFSARS